MHAHKPGSVSSFKRKLILDVRVAIDAGCLQSKRKKTSQGLIMSLNVDFKGMIEKSTKNP